MTRFVFVALVACGHPVATPPAHQSPAAPTGDPEVEAFADKAIADHKAVGLSIAVAHGDQIVLAKGFGFADVEAKTPATADTVYRIGSVTKQFTAVAILQLVEQGKLALTDDIRKYLPAYPTHGATITLEHLLTHTSGIPNYTDSDWIEAGKHAMTRAEVLARFQDKPLDFQPGALWAYSNSNYYLLGMVIEKVTGKSYADVIRDRVFVPAGMSHSAYCSDTLPNMAHGYSIKDGVVPAQPLDLAHPYAAGALCSTVLDLIAWQRALEHGKLLAPASLARMRTAGKLATGKPTKYGYGVFVSELDGHHMIEHAGGINGFTSELARYPDDDITIVVLANAEVDTPSKLGERIARHVLKLPEPTLATQQLADRKHYVGTFQLQGFGDGLKLRVFEEGDTLRTQADGQPAVTMLYQGHDTFVLDVDTSIKLVFSADATQFTLHQGGLEIEAKRVQSAP